MENDLTIEEIHKIINEAKIIYIKKYNQLGDPYVSLTSKRFLEIQNNLINLKNKNKMKNAKFGKLKLKDFLKGLITTVITAVLTGVFNSVQTGALPDANGLQTAGMVGLAGGIGYIIKNLGTNSEDKFLTHEPK